MELSELSELVGMKVSYNIQEFDIGDIEIWTDENNIECVITDCYIDLEDKFPYCAFVLCRLHTQSNKIDDDHKECLSVNGRALEALRFNRGSSPNIKTVKLSDIP